MFIKLTKVHGGKPVYIRADQISAVEPNEQQDPYNESATITETWVRLLGSSVAHIVRETPEAVFKKMDLATPNF